VDRKDQRHKKSEAFVVDRRGEVFGIRLGNEPESQSARESKTTGHQTGAAKKKPWLGTSARRGQSIEKADAKMREGKGRINRTLRLSYDWKISADHNRKETRGRGKIGREAQEQGGSIRPMEQANVNFRETDAKSDERKPHNIKDQKKRGKGWRAGGRSQNRKCVAKRGSKATTAGKRSENREELSTVLGDHDGEKSKNAMLGQVSEKGGGRNRSVAFSSW